MQKNQVLSIVMETLAEILLVEEDCIQLQTSSEDIDSWDSLQQINIILALESEFGVSFPTERIGELTSVESLVGFLLEDKS